MKTTNNFWKVALTALIISLNFNIAVSQSKVRLGVISMDTRGLQIDNETMTNLVHLELEKSNVYEVLDKYDVSDIVKGKGFNVNECFGKSCLVKIGELLGADKMLSGSAEKYGNKIIFIFRLIDVKTDRIEKTDVMEYINQQDQLQIMVRLSLNNIIGVENDKYLLDLLVNYDQPITSARTTLKLNGPRVGGTYVFGEIGERMQAPKEQGGYNMYPLSTLIGYQFEKQFLSSGDFQALFEVIPSVSGMESGFFTPSLTTMLGFRYNNSGIEFGLGPVFRITQTAKGYFDADGNWNLRRDVPAEMRDEMAFITKLDSRGDFGLSTGMVLAIGKTFRSGYLNVPVNAYFSPRKEGSVVGLIVGFNVANLPQMQKKSN